MRVTPQIAAPAREMLAAQKAMGEAHAVLEAAKDKDPKRADLWFALADLAVAKASPRMGCGFWTRRGDNWATRRLYG